jgi:hypothetical protein
MKGLKLLTIYPGHCLQSLSKGFSTSSVSLQRHYKLLIVGAGAGGCAVANKFTSKLGPEEVGVIEPNEVCIFHFSFHLNIKLNKLRKKNCFAILYIKCICFFVCVYICQCKSLGETTANMRKNRCGVINYGVSLKCPISDRKRGI